MSREYYDPWAKVGQSANNALFQYLSSRPNPQQQAAAQADIDAKRALTNKYGLESRQIQSQLGAPDAMRSVLANIYAQVEQPAPSPDFVGPGAPIAPSADVINQRYQQNMPDIFSTAMQYAGAKPQNIGDIFAAFAANSGANPDQITRAQQGAGMDFAKTREGFEADPSNSGFTLSPGAIRYDAEGNQVASAPFKEGGGFSVQLPDGTVVQQGGNLKLDPTKSTANDLQKEQVASAKLRGLLDYTRELAQKDPMNFGFPGFVKGTAQDVTTLLQGVSQTMGYKDTNEAVTTAQRDIAMAGIDPSLLSGVFDPDLPALQTAADLLVFQAASALAGQSGRSVSDKDVKYFKSIVGNPQSLFANQQKFLSKLDTIQSILGINENVADTALGGNVTGAASGQPSAWTDADEARLQELERLYGGQ
jgi:hypothetical protein